ITANHNTKLNVLVTKLHGFLAHAPEEEDDTLVTESPEGENCNKCTFNSVGIVVLSGHYCLLILIHRYNKQGLCGATLNRPKLP
uniref:Uncharacterized protein n=1 Tax=Salmo trutta TaxID=8032 RepID=A0A674AIT6_SALTR